MNRGLRRCPCLCLLAVLVACSPAPEPAPPAAQALPAPAAEVSPPLVPEPASEALPAWQPPSDAIPRAQWRESLAAAEAAMAAEDAVGALEHYMGILLARPDHAQALAGIEACKVKLGAQFEHELSAGRLPEAGRIEQALSVIDAVPESIAARAARREQAARAAVEVARASRLQGEGRVLDPADANAVQALHAALQVWPDFQPARAGLAAIRNGFLQQAWDAVQAGDYEASEQALRKARRVGGEPAPLQDMAARIVEFRQRRAEAMLSQGHAALDELDLVTAALRLADARRTSPQATGLDALAERLERVRHYGRHAPGQILRDRLGSGGQGPELVVIPHGRFRMGSAEDDPQRHANETPQHEVTFARGFALARNETTVAEFRRFVEATRHASVATRRGRSTVYDEKGGAMVDHPGVDWQREHAGRPALAELPVVHVAVADAEAYAAWLSAQTGQRYRLPSEAEFEYALRAGKTSRYPWGEAAPPAVLANLTGDGDRSRSGRRWSNGIRNYRDGFWGAAPVRSFPEEGFGSFDLAGNVSEWVQDCWHDDYRRAPADGSAWLNEGCEERVVRGASWASTLDRARSAFRQPSAAGQTHARLGFRVVREL